MASPPTSDAHSASVLTAFDRASITADMRERTRAGRNDPPIGPMDQFLGALLAHADGDGEVNVFADSLRADGA